MEKVVQGLAEAQALLGHDVSVLTSTYCSGGRPKLECYNNVNVHRLKSWRMKYPDLTMPLEIPIDVLLDADIVHVHGHYSLFCQRILDKAHKLSIKTACYFMAVNTFHDHPNALVNVLAPTYLKRTTVHALRKTNLVLVKSKRDLNNLKQTFGAEALYLPDAIDSSFFSKSVDCSDFRQKYHIKQQNIFLFIGRMHRLKGPDILVRALKHTSDDDIAAVFIGPDGGYKEEVVHLAEKLDISDKVYFLGYLDEITKMKAIDSAVSLVNPSITDNAEVFSIVLSEAWARGKPVIASRVGELGYRVKPNVNGLLVDPSNPQMLADAMLKLVDNKRAAKEMGENGKSEILSWDIVGQKSVSLYENALS